MAYGEKYHVIYCDRNGKQFRLGIHEWDYSGASVRHKAAPSPFTVTQETSSELKLGGIYPTRATVTLVSSKTFNMEELYTADERKYLVTHEPTDGSDQGKWYGNIIPNGFTEEMDNDVHYMVLTASDNLPTLKLKLFTQDDGTNYGLPDGDFEQSFMWVAKEALKKTGFLLPIWTMVDIQALISNSITSVTQELTRWDDHELRDNPPSTAQRHAELMSIIKPGYKIQITEGPHVGTIFTVVAVTPLPISSSQIGISITTQETVPSGMSFNKFDVFEVGEATGLVLSRRGHFNDVDPSEIGIFQEGADFSFLQIGDIVKISESAAGNSGTYNVTGFVASPPPSKEYIRIQLSPQVPVQVHENVIIEIISQNTDHPDPLAITVHDVRTYIADKDIEGKNYYEVNGSAMSTWDVLNNLAKQWNAKIFQNNGRWEIVRWNALAVDEGEYQYFVYNADGVQTGREGFGHDVVYPCKSSRFSFRPFGHSISMDRVLGAVGVNYKYKFKTDGDSLVNLIRNGNFQFGLGGAWNPEQYTPDRWVRRVDRTVSPPHRPKFFILTIGQPPGPGVDSHPPGIPTFMQITPGSTYHKNYHLRQDDAAIDGAGVNKGDELRITWWQKTRVRFVPNVYLTEYMVVRIALRVADGLPYYLVNDGEVNSNIESHLVLGSSGDISRGAWVRQTDGGPSWCFNNNKKAPGNVEGWVNVILDVPPVPESGKIVFEVVGSGIDKFFLPHFERSYEAYRPAPGGGYSPSTSDFRFTDSTIAISGLFIAKIVDESSEAVPLIHPYWYVNDGAYTDQIDDVEVLLGDDDSPDHVSNIYVMDGGQRRAIKLWDSWDNDFGWGALGLTLAKSVMQQYYRPWRIIDGDFVAPNIHWASRIEFEQRPGERYALLRGTIDPINNRFSGTIVQVADDGTPELPPGGNDGGSTVDPNWQPTGTIRCVRDENGENTGEQEQLEVDMNPSSQTSGQQRWVNIGENTEQCPIGEPIDLYWGASTLQIDPTTLEYFPYIKDGDNYTMQFSNDGTGKYLVFLWRKSLGTVQSILDVELEETISSWVVESDVTINGYTYGVMRMSYMTGVFTGLDKTFKIN